jgi:hypothetical protein
MRLICRLRSLVELHSCFLRLPAVWADELRKSCPSVSCYGRNQGDRLVLNSPRIRPARMSWC